MFVIVIVFCCVATTAAAFVVDHDYSDDNSDDNDNDGDARNRKFVSYNQISVFHVSVMFVVYSEYRKIWLVENWIWDKLCGVLNEG